jgi:reductive dehalogenase
MKELGKLGAAASLAPILAFNEQASDVNVSIPRPGFIKELPFGKPTTEMEWEQVERIAEGERTARGHFKALVGEDRFAKLTELQAANLDKYLKSNKAGYTLKDHAFKAGCGSGGSSQSFLGPQKAKTPEEMGVAKWQGTPEEALQLVRAAARHYGAAHVGVVELDANTERLLYAKDPDGKTMTIADVAEASESETERIIPKKARWIITYTVQMSEETLNTAPTIQGGATTNLTYSRNRNIQARIQEFLRGLGYMGLGESSTNALGIAPAFGVLSGLGELSRYNRLITPEYGSMVRVFKLATDLPLAPTPPIDAGLLEFCKTCKKCAEHCPSKALSFETEPYWEVKGEWNNPGHKAWFEDSVKCRNYWYEVGTNCGICFAVCPWASNNLASYHNMRNMLAATVPAFNSTLVSMDNLLHTPYTEFGKPQKDPELWWKQDLPVYGIDTTMSIKSV